MSGPSPRARTSPAELALDAGILAAGSIAIVLFAGQLALMTITKSPRSMPASVSGMFSARWTALTRYVIGLSC